MTTYLFSKFEKKEWFNNRLLILYITTGWDRFKFIGWFFLVWNLVKYEQYVFQTKHCLYNHNAF